MPQTGKSRHYKHTTTTTSKPAARERIETKTYTTPSTPELTDLQKLVNLANTRPDKGVRGKWSQGKIRDAVRRPDGRLTVSLKNGDDWVKGTYKINPEWSYRNIGGKLVHDTRPLLPWNRDFWDATGEILGDPKIWKRAGVELWKSSFALDIGHIAKEFQGDIDGAEADLDNYDAKQFGIDFAIMVATWGVMKAGGATAKFASQTATGQKALRQAGRARNALRQLVGGGLKKMGIIEATKFIRAGVKNLKTSIAEAGTKGTQKLSKLRKTLLFNEIAGKELSENLTETQLEQLGKSLLRSEEIIGSSLSSRIGQLEQQVNRGIVDFKDASKIYLEAQHQESIDALNAAMREYGEISEEFAEAKIRETENGLIKTNYKPPTFEEVGVKEEISAVPIMAQAEEDAQNILEKYSAETDFAQQVGEKPGEREAFLQVDTGGDLPINYEYLPDVSTQEIGVWKNGDKIHVHFTGAYKDELKNKAVLEGWSGTGAAGLGKSSNEAVAKVKDILNAYPEGKIYLSGYSKGGGVVNDVMIELGNNERIIEGLAIAPNTSVLSITATKGMAKLKGTAKAMEDKITTIRMANDPISENGLAYGKTVNLEHPTANGLDAHDITLWGDDGVKVVQGKGSDFKTIDAITETTKQTVSIGGREGRKETEGEALETETTPQITDTVIGETQSGINEFDTVENDDGVIFGKDAYFAVDGQGENQNDLNEFDTVDFGDEVIFGKDAYFAVEEQEDVTDSSEALSDFKDDTQFQKEYMQGAANERDTETHEHNHFHDDENEDSVYFTKPTKPTIQFNTYSSETALRQQPQILGYCVYPASLEQKYLNMLVQF